MCYRSSVISRVSALAVPFLILFSLFPGSILSAVVTLKSIELYGTHERIQQKPALYFECNGENRVSLPDVQGANVLYNFKGEESWQPLTKLLTKSCKRCKIFEELVMSDHVFDEWELCSSDFAAPDGNYTRNKENEFNATFLCKECSSLMKDSTPTSEDSDEGGGRKKHFAIPILVMVSVITVVAVIFMAACKYLRKKRRQQEQARFLMLFEDDDELEDEFGLNEMV